MENRSSSHRFPKLRHSSSTCVSTFCTPIPFDAVPANAAGLAHGPESYFYILDISLTPALAFSTEVDISRHSAPSFAASHHRIIQQDYRPIKNYNSFRRMVIRAEIAQ